VIHGAILFFAYLNITFWKKTQQIQRVLGLGDYFGLSGYIVAVFLPRQSAELAEVWGRLSNPLADGELVLEKTKWLASLC
jgi:hypothetical protein